MASAAFCRIFELDTGVPAGVVDEAVAVYRVVKYREVPTIKVHFIQTEQI